MNSTAVCELRLEVRDEVEHLGLDRRVEARRRLVEDQQLRVLGERHRDHDALLHPAGELMRVAAHHRARIRDLNLDEGVSGSLVRLLAGDPSTVNASATWAPTRMPGFNAEPGFW